MLKAKKIRMEEETVSLRKRSMLTSRGLHQWIVTYDREICPEKMNCLATAVGHWALLRPFDGSCKLKVNAFRT